MTNKQTKEKKTEIVPIRVTVAFKEELTKLSNLGVNVSNETRKYLETLVNRVDDITSTIDLLEELDNSVQMFLEYEDNEEITSSKAVDEIIYHCSDCKDKVVLVKSTRKSDKFQSKFNVKKFGKKFLKCGECLYLSVGSSSFYDIAFLRCIEFTKSIGVIRIEVLALTRSHYETITRSVLIADKVIQALIDNHISLVGMDIMMLRISSVMYEQAQVRRMNTQYSLKTKLFHIMLNDTMDKAKEFYEYHRDIKKYSNFKKRVFETYKREYRALYELNNLDKDKFEFHLQYLLAQK